MEKKELIGKPCDGADVMRHELLGFHEDPSRGIDCHDPHYAAMLAIEAAKRVDRALKKLQWLLSKISIGDGTGSGSGSGGGTGSGGEGGGGNTGEGGEGGGNIIVQVPGTKSAYRQIFTQSNEKPARPTGGIYDFVTDSLVPPVGWQNKNEFDGSVDIWFSYCTFHSDGTDTGWSEPMLFVDYDKFFDRIDEQVQGIWNDMLNDANADLNKVLADAKDILAESKDKLADAKDEIEEAKRKIEANRQKIDQQIEIAKQQIAGSKEIIDTAKETVAAAKQKLDALNESTGEAGFAESMAKIRAFAAWYDKEAATVFDLEFVIDAQNGKIQQIGQNVDAANNRVTELERTLDAKESAIYDRIELIDGENGTIDTLRREMSAKDSAITDRIERIDGANGLISNLERTMNAKDAAISDRISLIDSENGTVNELRRDMNAKDATIKDQIERGDRDVKDTLRREMDAMESTITDRIERIDGVNGTVTELQREMNAKDKKIEDSIKDINTVKQTVTNLSSKIDAAEATISDKVEYIDTMEERVNTVETTLSGFDGRIANIATTANNANSTVNQVRSEMSSMNAAIELAASTANTAENTANQAKLDIDALNKNINMVVSSKVDDAIKTAKIEISDEQIVAAITNSEGAGAAIIEQINADNSSEVIIKADKIALDGETIAQHLNAMDVNINNGASQFNKDGSGAVANGNISWDKDGNINIGGGLLEVNPDGEIVKTGLSDFPIGTVLHTTEMENPFGSLWEYFGETTIDSKIVFAYEKVRGGKDEWMNDIFKPDYATIDRLGMAMVDIYGKFYTTKAEWEAAGVPQLVGLAFSNGMQRFVMSIEGTYEETEAEYKGMSAVTSNPITSKENALSYFNGKKDTIEIIQKADSVKPGRFKTCKEYTFKNGKSGYVWSAGEALMVLEHHTDVNDILQEFEKPIFLPETTYDLSDDRPDMRFFDHGVNVITSTYTKRFSDDNSSFAVKPRFYVAYGGILQQISSSNIRYYRESDEGTGAIGGNYNYIQDYKYYYRPICTL